MSKIWRAVFKVIRPFAEPILNNSKRTRVLVIHKKQILLVKNRLSSQKWTLPGGGIKKKEKPKDAAKREIFEEIGYNLNPKQLVFGGKEVIHKPNSNFRIQAYIYLAYTELFEPKKQKMEILKAEWFYISELPKNRTATVDIALKYNLEA